MTMKLRFRLNSLWLSMAAFLLVACGHHGQHRNEQALTADSLFRVERDSLLAELEQDGTAASAADTIRIHYAKGLQVAYQDDGSIRVTISNPDAEESRATTLLLNAPDASDHPRAICLNTPIRGAICMTALQLSNFTALGLEDRIVGINSQRHLFNQRIRQQLADGTTATIGKEGSFDVEKVLAAQPDFIFVSASKRGGFEQLKDCGIPLIPHHGYKETDPLGQAEWLKLVGLLTGQTRRANAVFADIEKKYNTLRDEVARYTSGNHEGHTSRPTVLSGKQIRDGWYIMGGRSYIACIFADAGADYIIHNEETGGQTLDFETVYAQGINTEFWQIDGSFGGEFSYDRLAAEDPRYADLAAFKNHRIIYCDLSQTPYRELSPVEPHYLLADFVKAFHPEILPHYEPHYYRLLQP